LPPAKVELKLQVPAEIYRWKASSADRVKAAKVQAENREAFLDSFARDLAVLDYAKDTAGNGTFVLGHWDEDWSYASA
jgi:hypothetical protein